MSHSAPSHADAQQGAGRYELDLDAESIRLDDQWYTRDDLARLIRSMLDSGDFQIARPSQALEELNATLANLRTLAFRVLPELSDALNAEAARQERTPGAIVREALSRYLNLTPAEDSGTKNGRSDRSAPSANAAEPAAASSQQQTLVAPAQAVTGPVPMAPRLIPPPQQAQAPQAQAPQALAHAPPQQQAQPAPQAPPQQPVAAAPAVTPVSTPAVVHTPPAAAAAMISEDISVEETPPIELTPKKKERDEIERRWFGG